MRMRGWTIGAAMLAVSAGGWAFADGSVARRAALREVPVEPVVVELFTAQGCAGCPEANALIERLSDQPGVIVLTYAVDYWDYLGWPDTFAQPAFTERQRTYRGRLGARDIYTPQVVVDGRGQASGARADDVQALIEAEAALRRFPPHVEFRETGDRVGVGSGPAPAGGAEVWLVRYQAGPQIVQVRQGENRGLAVRHANVVRHIESLGEWRGRPVLLPIPEGDDDLSVAVLVQSRDDGAILAAAQR